jgi:hypothetical protein
LPSRAARKKAAGSSHHLFQAVGLVAFSGLVEILQFMALRHARVIDVVVDSACLLRGYAVAQRSTVSVTQRQSDLA